MNNFFTKRKTERENYKIIKSIKKNSDSFYRVAFKQYLFGWSILTHYTGYELHTTESVYKTKSQAKARIEEEVANAYRRIGNTVVKTLEVEND